jgi:hypothetical protein
MECGQARGDQPGKPRLDTQDNVKPTGEVGANVGRH